MSEFLDNLKEGDKVVLRNRRLDTFGRRTGPAIYTVKRIPPKRSKIVLAAADGSELEVKGGWNGMARLEPYTPEIDAEILLNDALIKAKNRAWQLTEQLRYFERQADDLPPEEIARFLEASKHLVILLKPYTEKK